jgi:integrase/recombinase XerD
MKSIIAERVNHGGVSRIALKFPYDEELNSVIKELPESGWSKTMKCWHLPDNKNMLERIPVIFRDTAIVDLSGVLGSSGEVKKQGRNLEKKADHSIITAHDKQLHDGGNIQSDEWTTDFKESLLVRQEKNGFKNRRSNYDPVEFTINESDGKLIIRFTGRYDKEWIKEMQSYGRIWFDSVKREWHLSWSRIKVDSLSDYYASRGVDVIVKKAVVPLQIKEKREEVGTEVRDRHLLPGVSRGIENMRRYLVEKRYSKNTIETYISLIELFLKYFADKDPLEISEEEISDFFHDFIIYHKYSASYHNQLISAIKMYYWLNGKLFTDTESLGRPRRSRALPKVFSKEEVKHILNASRNTKHRLILWMIYSCGLRRSEVINIRLTDLDRARGILNIREAKGMNDRIVPVSEKVWEKVDDYLSSYHPEFWLFEGQTRGKYSTESVYRVFKQALKNAGISKDVGVHSLRHSYATHLHENGVDIRYIQELLGHKSSRTTEVYTHVSRRNLVAVRSPIEDLDLK